MCALPTCVVFTRRPDVDALLPSSACRHADVEVLIGSSAESAHVKEPCVICVCTRVHSSPFVPVCSISRVLPTPVFMCGLPSPPPGLLSHSLIKLGHLFHPWNAEGWNTAASTLDSLNGAFWALEAERAAAFYTCGRARLVLNIN